MSELNRTPRNLNYQVIPIEAYEVASWCPLPDGKGPATMVVLELQVPGGPPMLLRFKSRDSAKKMIEALTFHMNDVWPA